MTTASALTPVEKDGYPFGTDSAVPAAVETPDEQQAANQDDELLQSLSLICPDRPVEIRALFEEKNRNKTERFADHVAASVFAHRQEALGAKGVYVGLNPYDSSRIAGVAVNDAAISRRDYVLIEADATRPANTNATDAEKAAAFAVMAKVKAHLASLDFPALIEADSGNGPHALLPIDLPNDEDSTALVKRFLERLAAMFDCAGAHVDTSVYNASRITKLYGTLTRKGPATAERPQRRSQLLSVPAPLIRASAAQLEQVAGPAADNSPADETEEHEPDGIALGIETERRKQIARDWLKTQPPAEAGKQGDNTTYRVACAISRGFDLSLDDTVDVMREWNSRCSPPWSERELREKIKHAIRYAKGPRGGSLFLKDAKGKIQPNHQVNIRRGLCALGVEVSFDMFAQRALIKYGDAHDVLNDVVVNRIRLEIETRYGFLPTKDHFFDVVQDIAHSNRFHPIRDYLRQLVWDGSSRLDRWLIDAAGAADTAFVRAVSAIVLAAAVRRVLQPGCKYDEMLVLESEQGLNKSSALQLLSPNRDWFSDDLPLNVGPKEIVERTVGKWIIEASELSGMTVGKIEHLKAMQSRQVDGPVRMAYARLPIEQPRQFVIIGTTNSHAYLLDGTGNRRFWPVRVEKFRLDWIAANRDQLWAEAFTRVQAGASIRLPEDLYDHAELQQNRRRVEDAWEPTLAEAFVEDYQRVTPEDVWIALGMPIERRDDRAQKRVSQIMQRLGFVRRTVVTKEGKRVWGWSRGSKLGETND